MNYGQSLLTAAFIVAALLFHGWGCWPGKCNAP